MEPGGLDFEIDVTDAWETDTGYHLTVEFGDEDESYSTTIVTNRQLEIQVEESGLNVTEDNIVALVMLQQVIDQSQRMIITQALMNQME